jgi:acetyl esterase
VKGRPAAGRCGTIALIGELAAEVAGRRREPLMAVHPQAQAVLDLLPELGLVQLSDLTVEQAREVIVMMEAETPRDDVAELRDLGIPGPGGDIPVRLYRPQGSSAEDVLPVLVYFHGGGWTIGSIESHDPTARRLANRAGVAVVSVDYRLGPEHPFPAAVEDAFAATQWIADNGAELGVDGSRLAVGGDSAGGNLAAVVALLARDARAPEIRLQVLVYPGVDARMGHPSIDENASGYLLTKHDMEWFYGHYGLGSAVQADDWRLSPLLASSHAAVAPALVITAEYDPLRDEGEAYAAALEAAGVPVQLARFDGMIHAFFTMGGTIDAADLAQDDVAKALITALG